MAHRLFISLLDRADLQQRTALGALQKTSQQLGLFRHGQVLMASPSPPEARPESFALPTELGLQSPHRSRSPSQGLGELIGV